MPLSFKDANGTAVSIGGLFWKDASGTVTAMSEGYAKFGNAVSQFWSSGLALSALPEGALVAINENGSPALFYVAKHDYESGLNGAGRTLMVRKDGYDKRAWGVSGNSAYVSSEIDNFLTTTYKALLDASVQEAISETTFYYTIGSGNNTVTTLSRSVFLLSLAEVSRTNTNANVEGSALPIAETLAVAYNSGTAVPWWLRTAGKGSSLRGYVFIMRADNTPNYVICTSKNPYSRPCFTLPADGAMVNPSQNADGSYTLLV